MADTVAAPLNPFLVELIEGRTYSWCRCARSARQPFCDGSHKGSGIEPLLFTARADRSGASMRLQADQRRALLRRLAQYPLSPFSTPDAWASLFRTSDPARCI